MPLFTPQRDLTAAGWTLGALALGLLAGCRSAEIESGPQMDRPRTLPPTLNIQVMRDGPTITLSNTSAMDFGPSMLWLNRWYGRPIDGLAMGETVTFNLGEFEDRYGDHFRPGGFFATERPDQLYKAELESEGEFYGLVVVGDDNEE